MKTVPAWKVGYAFAVAGADPSGVDSRLPIASEAFEQGTGQLACDAVLPQTHEVEAVGRLLVAHQGVAVVAQGGDAAELGRADAPCRQGAAFESLHLLRLKAQRKGAE